MSQAPRDLWERAIRALCSANLLRQHGDPDRSASAAYYAAFYAASALFSLDGKSFRKHAAVEAAVHRDLVHTGRWDENLGTDYAFLQRIRLTGDYGGSDHVPDNDAGDALAAARRILEAVRRELPADFPEPPPAA